MIRPVSESELASVFQLMRELRPHLTEKSFNEIYQSAKKADGYALYGYYQNSECIGLMGARFLSDYVHGFHLYIDDLVTSAKARSKGIGAELLKFAENLAKEKNCTGLRLCTGVDNKDGMRFYEREGWASRAVVYKKKVTG